MVITNIDIFNWGCNNHSKTFIIKKNNTAFMILKKFLISILFFLLTFSVMLKN